MCIRDRLKADPACAEVNFNGDAFRLLEETMGKIYPGYGVAPYIMTGGTDAPVSYTHLDVYKRQWLFSTPPSPCLFTIWPAIP